PLQEPEVRDPDQLHYCRGSDAYPRRREPVPDGGAPHHPVRDRHHLRPCVREEESRGRDPGGREVSPLSFSSLELPGPVRRGIEDAGFVATTAIQEAALPL